MSEQPVTSWSPIDDQMLSAILDEDERALRVLSLAARYHQARMAHLAGKAQEAEPLIPEAMWDKATDVPSIAAPLPSHNYLGHALAACIAIALILAGFLVGVTQHPWVAIGLVTAGCAIGARLAAVHHRMGEKS